MKRICLLGAVVAIAVCCGCKKSTTVTGPSGEQTTVTNKGDNVEVTIEDREGKKMTIKGRGRGTPLPEGFPKDVPIYPGAKVEHSFEFQQGKPLFVELEADDGVAQVAEHYKTKLQENGWEMQPGAARPAGESSSRKRTIGPLRFLSTRKTANRSCSSPW